MCLFVFGSNHDHDTHLVLSLVDGGTERRASRARCDNTADASEKRCVENKCLPRGGWAVSRGLGKRTKIVATRVPPAAYEIKCMYDDKHVSRRPHSKYRRKLGFLRNSPRPPLLFSCPEVSL